MAEDVVIAAAVEVVVVLVEGTGRRNRRETRREASIGIKKLEEARRSTTE